MADNNYNLETYKKFFLEDIFNAIDYPENGKAPTIWLNFFLKRDPSSAMGRSWEIQKKTSDKEKEQIKSQIRQWVDEQAGNPEIVRIETQITDNKNKPFNNYMKPKVLIIQEPYSAGIEMVSENKDKEEETKDANEFFGMTAKQWEIMGLVYGNPGLGGVAEKLGTLGAMMSVQENSIMKKVEEQQVRKNLDEMKEKYEDVKNELREVTLTHNALVEKYNELKDKYDDLKEQMQNSNKTDAKIKKFAALGGMLLTDFVSKTKYAPMLGMLNEEEEEEEEEQNPKAQATERENTTDTETEIETELSE